MCERERESSAAVVAAVVAGGGVVAVRSDVHICDSDKSERHSSSDFNKYTKIFPYIWKLDYKCVHSSGLVAKLARNSWL